MPIAPRRHRPAPHRGGGGARAARLRTERRAAPVGRRLVEQRRAVQLVLVQIGHDLVAVLDQRDRAADGGLRADMADHQADRAAREAGVGHQADDDSLLAAQRGDARGRIEHLGHSGRSARALPAGGAHSRPVSGSGTERPSGESVRADAEADRRIRSDVECLEGWHGETGYEPIQPQ